jgi:hypothetical protein
MHEDLKEIKKGALNELGKHLVIGALIVLVAIGGPFLVWGKELWAWWKGFHFTDAMIWRIEFWAFISAIVVLVIDNLRLRIHINNLENPPPFLGQHGTLDATTFEVLKAFERIGRHVGFSINDLSSDYRIQRDVAQASVMKLHELGLITTKRSGPGQWNGVYTITHDGLAYVRIHAT